MLTGMRGAANALLDAGNDLIIDEMPLDETIVPAWRRDLRASASFWVHLTAPLEVLEQREQSRTRGQHLGNARGHFGVAPSEGWDLTLPVEAGFLNIRVRSADEPHRGHVTAFGLGVPCLDDTHQRAIAVGAIELYPPTDGQNMPRHSLIVDPVGNRVVLWESGK